MTLGHVGEQIDVRLRDLNHRLRHAVAMRETKDDLHFRLALFQLRCFRT
jgi:hypothetical protein